MVLRAGETANINIIAVPGSYGRFDALIYILMERKVFISSFRAHVFPNRFGLEPIYMPVLSQFQVPSIPLTLGNPYPMAIDIEEIHFTNPNFVPVDIKESVEATSNRTICNITYQATDGVPGPVLETTMVSIRFSTGDYLRIPIYLRTLSNFIETTPMLMDFGLVQVD